MRDAPGTEFYNHKKESPIKWETSEPLTKVSTPTYDSIVAEANRLNSNSLYKSDFNYRIYKDLEIRYFNRPIRGGLTLKTAFRLVNSHSTCQQCLYAFEIDTYGRGCIHDCGYCYAKAELSVHGWWNNPIPVPVDINEIRKAFYLTFETDKNHRWRDILRRRIPLRIGSMSDSFMWSEKKFGLTAELLKILKFYRYPYIVFTRSDLVADDSYMKLLDPNLAAIQFSISSTNEELSRKIEPGAPSPRRRLAALSKLAANGLWTTVRVNPFFPIYPDGYFSDPEFKWEGNVPKFPFSSFEMIDEIAAANVPAVLVGFVRLSSYAINNIQRSTGFNLRPFYRKDIINKSPRDFHFSDSEIRAYYKTIKNRCIENGLEFSTCYIGNGESHFWRDQDLWTNNKDCCNAKDRVGAFENDCRQIPFTTRLKFSGKKDLLPLSDRLHASLGRLPERPPAERRPPEISL